MAILCAFNRPGRQRGVALITVLLVFAVVAVIAAEMLRRSQLNLRSVSNLIDARQAWYYALSGEALARQVLAADTKSDNTKPNKKDSLDEDWARLGEQQPFESEGGAIKVEIHDLQGRFNLNSIVDDKGQLIEGEGLQRLRQLFIAAGVDGAYANAWRNWVSASGGAAGSGDTTASAYEPPERPEADISALRMLNDMTPADYDKIAPHVATLPTPAAGQKIDLNINTADATVLASFGGVIASQASTIRSKQRSGGYAKLDDVPGAIDVKGIGVTSSYFEVITTVKYLDQMLRLRSVLERDQNSGAITVRSRTRMPFFDNTDSENPTP